MKIGVPGGILLGALLFLGPLAGEASAATIFEDDFERSASTTVGNSWDEAGEAIPDAEQEEIIEDSGNGHVRLHGQFLSANPKAEISRHVTFSPNPAAAGILTFRWRALGDFEDSQDEFLEVEAGGDSWEWNADTNRESWSFEAVSLPSWACGEGGFTIAFRSTAQANDEWIDIDDVVVLCESGQQQSPPPAPPSSGGGSIYPTAPDLSVTKTVSNPVVLPGATLTYTITVANNGTGTAASVAVEDTLPPGLDGTPGSSRLWTIGNLHGGGTEVITYDIDVASAIEPGTYTNQVVVTSANHAAVTASADVTIPEPQVLGVDALPELSITQSFDPFFIVPGGSFEVTITVENTGDGVAENVRIGLNTPDGIVQRGEGDERQANAVLAAVVGKMPLGAVSWSIGDLLPGESWTGTVSLTDVAMLATGFYAVEARAAADNADQVSVAADLEIRTGEVLGLETLPETGGVSDAMATFGLVTMTLLALYGAAIAGLNRRREMQN